MIKNDVLHSIGCISKLLNTGTSEMFREQLQQKGLIKRKYADQMQKAYSIKID